MVKFNYQSILRLAAPVFIFIIYVPSFYVPFIFDDLDLIVNNSYIRTLWPPWASIFTIRPVVDLSLAVNFALGGLHVIGYHLFNLFVHMAASLALFVLCRKLFLLPCISNSVRSSADRLAFAAALIWAAHPLHTESVTYIIQRAEPMGAFFYFMTMYSFLRYVNLDLNQKQWGAASVFFCAVGMGCKITMVTAPFMILMLDRIFISRSWKSVYETRRMYFVTLFSTYGVMALAYYLPLHFHHYALIQQKVGGFSFLYLANQSLSIWRYLALIVWPSRLCIDYFSDLEPFSHLVIPCISLGTIFVAVLFSLKKHPHISFLGLWFFLTLLPSSSFFFVTDIMAERRTYLPLAGLTVLLVIGLHSLISSLSIIKPDKKAALFFMTTLVIATLFGMRTMFRNIEYLNLESFWSGVIKVNPSNVRAYNAVAQEQIEQGDWESAAATLRVAISNNPEAAREFEADETSTALSFPVPKINVTDRALMQKYSGAGAFSKLGIYYSHRGDDAEAIKNFIHSVRLYPWDPAYYFNLGAYMAKKKKYADAAAYFRMALSINPHHERSLAGLKYTEQLLDGTSRG